MDCINAMDNKCGQMDYLTTRTPFVYMKKTTEVEGA